MIGVSLGPYRIDRELGSGGMGKVYAATGPDGVVALKIVHPHLLEQPGFFKRFLREADIGKSVRHDNVVRTLDCDQLVSGGQANAYLVMEYVEGQTLADLQRELERVPEELCRHVAREICKGLAAIHEAGVVHRDLKPENVLITPDHCVKVMDLGVAQLADEQMRLSQSGAFIGSVEYAAPEQFGGKIDHRCDLHALGLLLYEVASGVHPYRANTFPEVMKRIRDESPRRLGDVHPQLSPFFEEVIDTLLAKSADERFRSADEVLAVLEEGESSAWWRERAQQLRAATRRPVRRIRIPRETAVYGRENELAKLSALYEKAKSGDGQVVLIEGEAGIGKSRLIDELIGRLQADGEDINFLFGSYPPGGAALSAGGFSAAYREQFGEAGSADYLVQTPVLAPAFDAVLRGEPAPADALGLTRDSLGTCFVHATRKLAAERPTTILIDDLHFAPEESRAVFTALSRAAPGHRLLLIGTMRPGVSEDWRANLSRLDYASSMGLSRLGPSDLGALLEDAFASESLAAELGYRIVTKSDGNPFFVFEIIRGLREGQFITQREDGTWVSTRAIDDIQIPSSVLDLVNARVADLSEEQRDLLDVACCWGYEFDPLLVADVLEVPRIPLLKRLGQIERQHRLVRSVGVQYVFDHHQIQEALYGSLSELLRREYHAALATALESRTGAAGKDPDTLDGALCVDLVDHFLRGATGERAVRYLRPAQMHLQAGGLHAQSVALGERALAVPGLLEGKQRAKALFRLCGPNGALDMLGRRTRQEGVAREAIGVADAMNDNQLRVDAARALGWCFSMTCRFDESVVVYARALEFARSLGKPDSETAVENDLGRAFTSLGRFEAAEEHLTRALAAARRTGHQSSEATALGNLGLNYLQQRRFVEARELFGLHLTLSREMGNRRWEAAAMGNLAIVHWHAGHLQDAREHVERAAALSREIGDRAAEASAAVNLGSILDSEGRMVDGLDALERGRNLCREVGHREFESNATINLAITWWSLGDIETARSETERFIELSRSIRHRRNEAQGLLFLGHLDRESGDDVSARKHVLAGLAVSTEHRAEDMRAHAYLGLGRLQARAHESTEAQQSLIRARDLARDAKDAEAESIACCELALLPGGDAAEALEVAARHKAALPPEILREVSLLLWKATEDSVHLSEAKRLLDEALANVPGEYHDGMRNNIGVNREILAAWREEFGEGDAPDRASPGEYPTRAG